MSGYYGDLHDDVDKLVIRKVTGESKYINSDDILFK